MNEINTTQWICRDVDEDLNKELLEHFRGERSGFIQVGPKKYFLPQKFAKGGEKYYRFKPRSSDTWIVSFPRSGTTWTQEMVWLLGNGLNLAKSEEVPLVERFPFLEFDSCVHEEVLNEFLSKTDNEQIKKELQKACGPVLEGLQNMTEPRFIKTHLPFSLLNPELLECGAKVIYIARNPKDVAVSYYHFHQFIKTLDYVGDFKTFWNFFEKNLELWTPYWDHINEAWQERNNPNLLFLFYEDLKKKLAMPVILSCTLMSICEYPYINPVRQVFTPVYELTLKKEQVLISVYNNPDLISKAQKNQLSRSKLILNTVILQYYKKSVTTVFQNLFVQNN